MADEIKPVQVEKVSLTSVATKEDPANIPLHRIVKMKDINGVEFEVEVQQGVYSKADLQNIADQIQTILAPQ